MGANQSKRDKKLQIVDFGSIHPLGLYNKCCDEYDLELVKELILNKKLSPFYKGLSNPLEQLYTPDNKLVMMKSTKKDKKRRSIVIYKKRKQRLNEREEYHIYLFHNEQKLYNLLYSNAIECPICFLFYPANINFTRCCDQPICTECFVQIKKGSADNDNNNTSSSSTTSHIACPFCMTKEFGIIYTSPSSSTTTTSTMMDDEKKIISTTSGLSEIQRSKRKSIESSHPDVVLIDHVRSQQPQNNNTNVSNNNSSRTRLERANSLHYWFQSRPNATSLERYLGSIRLDTLSMQDIIVIETIRQSIIDKEQERLLMY